ncbi:hypothetical protein AgCh_034492 [Apium graveolens]
MRGSLGSLEDVKKKTSELGTPKDSLASKVSDGSSSLAKTSGSAKISDKADFMESGKSSTCVRVEGRTTFHPSEIVVLKIPDMCKTDNDWVPLSCSKTDNDWVPLSNTRIRRRLNIQRIGLFYKIVDQIRGQTRLVVKLGQSMPWIQ